MTWHLQTHVFVHVTDRYDNKLHHASYVTLLTPARH